MDRLQTVSDVRQRPSDDHAHRVIEIRRAHLVFDGNRGQALVNRHPLLLHTKDVDSRAGGADRRSSHPPTLGATSPARPKSAETDFISRGTRPFPLAARSGHCPTRRHLQEAGAGSASNAAVEERHHPLSEGAPTGSGRQSPLLALLFVSLHIKVFHLERVLLDEVAPWLHLV